MPCGLCSGQTPCAWVFSGCSRFFPLSSFHHPYGLRHNCLKTLKKNQFNSMKINLLTLCSILIITGIVLHVSSLLVTYKHYVWHFMAENIVSAGPTLLPCYGITKYQTSLHLFCSHALPHLHREVITQLVERLVTNRKVMGIIPVTAHPERIFRYFPQSHQANAGRYPLTRSSTTTF